MLTVDCAQCGGRFQAKRHTAKYCSPRCRMRAKRAPSLEGVPERRDTSAPVVGLPKREPDENGLLGTTRRELEEAGRLNTSKGQAALLLATILDSGIQDTGSSIAALVRQHQASMEAALDGVRTAATPLEQIKASRERRSA